MSIFKKMRVVLVILTILMLILPQFCIKSTGEVDETGQTVGLTKEMQDYVQAYIRAYLQEAYKQSPNPLQYDGGKGGGGGPGSYGRTYYQNELPATEIGCSGNNYSNKLVLVCSVFTASMLHQSLDVVMENGTASADDIKAHDESHTVSNKLILASGDFIRGAGYSAPGGRGGVYFNLLKSTDYLQPGDILMRGDHSMIYVGVGEVGGRKYHQIAQTTGTSNVVDITNLSEFSGDAPLTVAQVQSVRTAKYPKGPYQFVHRLKPEVIPNYDNWTAPSEIRIQWPSGMWSVVDPSDISISTVEYDPAMQLFYPGLASPSDAPFVKTKYLDLSFSNIINYIVGGLTLILRAPFIGLAYWTETLTSSAIQAVSLGSGYGSTALSFESIIFNQVPIFDINIFNFNKAGGLALDDSPGAQLILTLRENLARLVLCF